MDIRCSRLFSIHLLLFSFTVWAFPATAENISTPATSSTDHTPPLETLPAISSASSADPATTTRADRIMPLEVLVNGSKSGTWLFVEHAGALYAPKDAFEEWRVQLDPTAQHIRFRNEDYWPLAAVPGYKSKVDFSNQSLELLFSPRAFAETRLSSKMLPRLSVSPAEPSVFFNYDVNYQRTATRMAPTTQSVGMLSEIGVSSDLGVLTSSGISQNLTNDATAGNPRSFRRLETTLTTHFPDQNMTLRLGDTATRAGMLGTSLYFGGIRFGSNFGLTPGFVSQPVPILTGSSAAPSTVNLYVNDVLRQTSSVPTGPFAIDNFPALTGGGDVRMVVRDLLGRETVIQQSFFTNSKLLAPGLDDWSAEAGKVRRNLGIANADYGPTFARGIWRHGMSDKMTLEGMLEASPKQSALELGLLTALPGQWLGSFALAASREPSLGSGGQWLLGLEQQGLHSSIYLQAQGASENYRELGQDSVIKPIKRQLAANWTYASQNFGSFGVGFASVESYDDPRVNTVSANYSMNIGARSSLNLNASRSLGAYSGSALGLSLIMPLDNNRIISTSANRSGKQTDFYLAATQNPTQENNLGWRVLAGHQQNVQHGEGGVNYLGRYGSFSGDVSASPDQTTLRLSGSGGMALVDSHLFATRRQAESYALAEVAGYGDVGIGLGNNVLARTDADGIALVPLLVPYQGNSVRLDPNDLPVSAEIDSIEQIAVPAWRSVVKVIFPVRGGRGALVKTILDDGEVAPAGAIVQIEGDAREFYVARRGEAFVTGLQAVNRVRLKWKEQQCAFDVTLPAGTPDEIPHVGPLLCKGVTR